MITKSSIELKKFLKKVLMPNKWVRIQSIIMISDKVQNLTQTNSSKFASFKPNDSYVDEKV